MERTANMTFPEFAQFIVKTLDDPTEGTILDALKEQGASDDEIQESLAAVKDMTVDPQIGTIDDPDKIIQEGKDPEEANPPSDGMTLQEFVRDSEPLLDPDAEDQGALIDNMGDPSPVDEVDQLNDDDPDKDETGDEVIPHDPGDPLDDEDVEDATLTPDEVPLDNDELMNEIAHFTQDNPTATEEDLTRHLHSLGVPGDKLREFMKGYALLKNSKVEDILSMVIESNVSYSDAAQWASAHTNLKAEEIRQALYEAGASEREADEAVQALPPKEPLQDPAVGENAPNPADPGSDDDYSQDQSNVDPDLVAEATQLLQSNMTPEDVMGQLQGEGASPEDAQAAVTAAQQGDSTFDPQAGDQVMTPKGAARVAHVHEGFSGNVYDVVTDNNEKFYFGINSLSRPAKTASATEDIWGRVQSHMQENWYSDMQKLPRAAKGAYETRLAATQEIRSEIKQKISDAPADEQKDLLDIDVALENEEDYIKEKLKSSFTLAEADYLTSRPQFEVTAAHSTVGIGRDDGVVAAAALETDRYLASIDWKSEVTAGADLFVLDVHPKYIADAGEVRKQATRYITQKTASLPSEDAELLRKQFVANVEKARKAAVIEVRKTASTKTASVELPEDAERGLFF